MNRTILRVVWHAPTNVWRVVRGNTTGFESVSKQVAEEEALRFAEDLSPAQVFIEDTEGIVVRRVHR